MKTLAILSSLCATAAFAAMPQLDKSSVTVRQDGGKSVIIEYKLNPSVSGDNEPAIVTVDILTNAVGDAAASVGGEHLQTLSGDVNKVVTHTADYKHKIIWNPAKEGLPEIKLPASQVTARLTVWATNAPPDYWVIDLNSPSDRTADRYYPNAGQIPGTVTNRLYKTDRLVMRRIPAKGVTWRQGNTSSAGNNIYRYVSFSQDYYMAVFELTKKQYSYFETLSVATSDECIPMNNKLTWFRGNVDASGAVEWPLHGRDKVANWMSGVRKKLALNVDLPTSAEWEFACRAGSSTKYCNGDTEADLDKVGWYKVNSGGVLHDVGTKEPNEWGLYDMHGNIFEWTLTRFATRSSSPVWDPKGPAESEVSTTDKSAIPYAWSAKVWCVMGGRANGSDYNTAGSCTSCSLRDLTSDTNGPGCRLILPMD